MDIRFQTGGPSHWKADVVITFVFEGEGVEEACSVLAENALWLNIAPAWRDFRGRAEELVMFYGPQAMDVRLIASTPSLVKATRPPCRGPCRAALP